jgi:hypothetical protein
MWLYQFSVPKSLHCHDQKGRFDGDVTPYLQLHSDNRNGGMCKRSVNTMQTQNIFNYKNQNVWSWILNKMTMDYWKCFSSFKFYAASHRRIITWRLYTRKDKSLLEAIFIEFSSRNWGKEWNMFQKNSNKMALLYSILLIPVSRSTCFG